jgi:hypothetical protein
MHHWSGVHARERNYVLHKEIIIYLLRDQGKLGAEFEVEQGQECARVCAINIINQVYGVGSCCRV